jgi:hypothetical protein
MWRGAAMRTEIRKTRLKSLKRIINSLSIKLNELMLRGESDIEDLQITRSAIINFCDKLVPCTMNISSNRHESTDHGYFYKTGG